MDGTIIGQVTAAKEAASGMKNGKAWTKFEVMINGEKCSTFDRQFLGEVGKPAQEYGYKLNTWTDKGGRQHNDKTLIELQRTENKEPLQATKQASPAGSSTGSDTVFLKLVRMEKMLEKIGKKVMELNPDEEIPKLSEEEIKTEEIPF